MSTHHEVRVRRAYEEPEDTDGVRVLVDRLWPRGLAKEKAALDEWCKQIAPSSDLRTWYRHDPDRFGEFERRYREELSDPERTEALEHLREIARNRTLTLITATRHPEISEAEVLARVLS
ncbi:DUF488 family protein [Streptomyces sp. Vc74B-19]|uniref:DUF488 domain-containing protein n=1 Tax=unclassified Streptomyces TaxID=2593676 RepID=UPI001BFC3B2B|nr:MULTISPECIES: DUF488 family protein [unclassified Streptomyces]MBT3162221.1 DUF488 family protein [Streptomyces sp. Vc74B-19]MCO4696445.1 hypothetical protein [Streptomyces sp. RO-S4]MDU0304195.1 DUF488 family protein [Streptomyces sp. PAL114]